MILIIILTFKYVAILSNILTRLQSEIKKVSYCISDYRYLTITCAFFMYNSGSCSSLRF